jgi:nicotinate-nucleotide pyrophosphorylase (carboxylating)
MILIKDTHVKRSGSVTNALNNALAFKRNNPQLKIEVEVQSVAEFHEAVVCKPDRIMLDNMSKQDMAKCVQYLKENNIQIETEASGNITLVTIADIAQTGVDFISSGAITHSAPALDIHLVIA